MERRTSDGRSRPSSGGAHASTTLESATVAISLLHHLGRAGLLPAWKRPGAVRSGLVADEDDRIRFRADDGDDRRCPARRNPGTVHRYVDRPVQQAAGDDHRRLGDRPLDGRVGGAVHLRRHRALARLRRHPGAIRRGGVPLPRHAGLDRPDGPRKTLRASCRDQPEPSGADAHRGSPPRSPPSGVPPAPRDHRHRRRHRSHRRDPAPAHRHPEPGAGIGSPPLLHTRPG